MIVDRSGGSALPLGRSGIPVEARITFFDQVCGDFLFFHRMQITFFFFSLSLFLFRCIQLGWISANQLMRRQLFC